MYKSIIKPIEDHDVIIIHRHLKPDGDAVGSQIGLKEALTATYPHKKIFAVGDVNDRYEFIGSVDQVDTTLYHNALVIVVDTPEEDMISDNRYKLGAFFIKIDHHPARSSYGNIEIVDTNYESCAGLVADIVFTNGFILTSFGARALFTGIVTDSGRFRYSSISAKTFELTAKLLQFNFDFNEIYNNLYVEDIAIVKLRAYFVQKFKLTPNNVAYIKTTADELNQYGIDVSTASRGMVNAMAGIKGVDIWVNFTEDMERGNVIAEIRSSKYNISEVAVKFGGGGHRNASGAVLGSFTECDVMLAELDSIVKGKE
ncbi:MAG: bifunctional oligoribonuclease/PAP phosphatase NrnA [Bacilli bacterium]|nr:bifunctional oligoribonuclease/PAP phosphatase NrnA [Bacilli bacterium]MDD4076593.1 bifunctional oligoribonuclease/PAP phosphatase NrnA [Bacilli bacterium]MDD4387708.1 bifunctional oligoribonuclease/PAP phosphatase NrnA [Bacilli bacterium]